MDTSSVDTVAAAADMVVLTAGGMTGIRGILNRHEVELGRPHVGRQYTPRMQNSGAVDVN